MRVVVPGVAHHVKQRGNWWLETFISDGGYEAYRALLDEFSAAAGVLRIEISTAMPFPDPSKCRLLAKFGQRANISIKVRSFLDKRT